MKIFNIVCWFNNIERQSLKKVKKPMSTSWLIKKLSRFPDKITSIKKCDTDNRIAGNEYPLWVTHWGAPEVKKSSTNH